MARYVVFTILLSVVTAVSLHCMQSEGLGWNGAQYDKASEGQFQAGLFLIKSYLSDLPQNAIVGELGCGTGRLAAKISQDVVPGGKVIGVDNCWSMLDEALRKQDETPISNLSFELQDVCDLKFDDNSFDAHISVFCLHWVQTFDGMRAALQGIARTLKPGGKFVAIFNMTDSEECPFLLQRIARGVIRSEKWKSCYVGNYEEVKVLGNLLTLNDYRTLLQEAGFNQAQVFVQAPPVRNISKEERIASICAIPFGQAIPQERKAEFLADLDEMLISSGMMNADGTYQQYTPSGIIVAQKLV